MREGLRRFFQNNRRIIITVAGAMLLMVLVSCLPSSGRYGEVHMAGFFSGIWHGWLAPLSLILEIFNPNVRIYEPYNTGWWYDFGFYMAIISGFGGLSLVRRNRES